MGDINWTRRNPRTVIEGEDDHDDHDAPSRRSTDTQVTDPDPDSGRGPDGRSRRIRGLADKTPPDQTARRLDFTGAQDGSDGNGWDDEKFPPDCDPKTLFKKLFDDTVLARIVKCQQISLARILMLFSTFESTFEGTKVLLDYIHILNDISVQ